MRALVRIDRMNEDDLAEVTALDAPSAIHEDDLRAELGRPWSRQWVAREAGVGVIAFLVVWHVTDEIQILNLVTREDRRRQGVARTLLRECLEYAGLVEVARVLLEVRRSNRPAISLYRSFGFYAFAIRARYYPDSEDAVEMALTFDPGTRQVESRPDEVHLGQV